MRGERELRDGGRDWRRGRGGETREIMEGGVTEEEMGFEGEIGGESERGVKVNGFWVGMRFFFFNLIYALKSAAEYLKKKFKI